MSKNIFKEKLIQYGVGFDKVDLNFPVILVGTLFSEDNKDLVQQIVEKQEKIIYCSSLEDTFLHKKEYLHVKHEIEAESGILALLAKELFKKEKNLDKELSTFLDELDDGYLSAESSVGDEEIEEIANLIKNSSKSTILFGSEIYNHPKADEIAALLTILTSYKTLYVSLLDNSSHTESKNELIFPEIDELPSYDGTIVYVLPSKDDDKKLFGSAQFSIAAKIKDKDIVEIKIEDKTYKREFCLKNELKGTVAILPMQEEFVNYRFQKAKIKKSIDE